MNHQSGPFALSEMLPVDLIVEYTFDKPAGISTISLPDAKIHTFTANFMVMKRTNCVERGRGMLHALPYRALSVCQLFRTLPQLPDKQGQVYMHCLVIICVQHPVRGHLLN